MINLKGKVAVVTGGGRGIGAAIAGTLAEFGCSVVISDVDLENAKAVAETIKDMGPDSMAVQTNVVKLEETQELMDKVVGQFQRIDILVNNAGITRDNLLLRMSEADWDAVIAVNLKGAFNGIKAVTRQMMKQRSGKIINISSVVGVMGNGGQANYAASKAGVIGLTKSVAKEFGSRNIQVNAIAPGYIETDMTKSLPQTAKDSFVDLIPLNRAGQAQDVANGVLFLASDLSDYITGQVIHVDGGMVM